MPRTETKKYTFVEYFSLNNGQTISLPYGRVGGKVSDKPYSLEDAVIEYTTAIFRLYGINAENIDTVKGYGDIGPAISQRSLLCRTYFGSVLDHSLDGVRSLLGEVRRHTAA